jgi:hypothetical protein
VSKDTSDQQTFPRLPMHYISGCSDKNQVSPPVIVEVNHKPDQNGANEYSASLAEELL